EYDSTLQFDCDAMAREFYFYFLSNESQVCKSGASARATVEELERIKNIKDFLEYLQKQGKENPRGLKQLPIVMQFCDDCIIDYRIFSTISQSNFIKEQISILKSIANKLNSSLHDRKLLQQCAGHVLAQMPTFNQDEICLHSLDECIQQVLDIEYAHGKNWNFECNCKHTSTITLQKKLLIGPQYLIIHLKRAKTDQYNFTSAITHSPSWSRTNSYSHSSSKYNHNVSFKEEFILNSQTYQLCGVCNHSGSSSDFGHYIAHVRRFYDKEWYKMNDSYISFEDTSPSCDNFANATVLLYQKIDAHGSP
ncbi:hypothetical protein RFI_26102, partial [Reticulomyxa filosa]